MRIIYNWFIKKISEYAFLIKYVSSMFLLFFGPFCLWHRRPFLIIIGSHLNGETGWKKYLKEMRCGYKFVSDFQNLSKNSPRCNFSDVWSSQGNESLESNLRIMR